MYILKIIIGILNIQRIEGLLGNSNKRRKERKRLTNNGPGI